MDDAQGSPELLSSRATFFFKYVFSALWVGVFSGVALFVAPSAFAGGTGLRWLFLGVAFGIGGWLCWFLGGLKRVALAGCDLSISDFRRTERVALKDIERVSVSRFTNPSRIRLDLSRPTAFGARIVFVPKRWVVFGYGPHPMAERLKRLVGEASRCA